jgi:hypothetical protein
MRTAILTTVVLLASSTAFAQSGQGGYLGENPGKNLPTASQDATKLQGSGQGGYLGKNPAKDVPVAARQQGTPPHGSGEGGYLGSTPGAATTSR